MPLSYKDVAELLRIIDASACEEVILEVEGLRLVVRRGAAGRAVADRSAGPAASSEPGPAARKPALTDETRAASASASAAQEREDLLQVRAPMIGTFYRRPSPNDQPFVEAGERVAKGDPLCVIEVMKLYSTITAPEGGTVERIAAEDGALVEFDQLLFVIRPG